MQVIYPTALTAVTEEVTALKEFAGVFLELKEMIAHKVRIITKYKLSIRRGKMRKRKKKKGRERERER